jgi:hypothetical protein
MKKENFGGMTSFATPNNFFAVYSEQDETGKTKLYKSKIHAITLSLTRDNENEPFGIDVSYVTALDVRDNYMDDRPSNLVGFISDDHWVEVVETEIINMCGSGEQLKPSEVIEYLSKRKK